MISRHVTDTETGLVGQYHTRLFWLSDLERAMGYRGQAEDSRHYLEQAAQKPPSVVVWKFHLWHLRLLVRQL
jgi:hypothetical protein